MRLWSFFGRKDFKHFAELKAFPIGELEA